MVPIKNKNIFFVVLVLISLQSAAQFDQFEDGDVDKQAWIDVFKHLSLEQMVEIGKILKSSNTSNLKPRTWEDIKELVKNKGGKHG